MKYPRWCKDVKIAMIDQDVSMNELSENIHVERTRTSKVVNGRVIAPEIAYAIASYLGVDTPYKVTIG